MKSLKWLRPFATLITFLFLSQQALAASSVFVEQAEGTGQDKSTLETVTELTGNAVSETSGYNLANDKKTADIVLQTKLLKLGDSYILSMTKVTKGKKAFSAKMKASGLEDVDMVTARLVKSVLNEVSPKGNASITDVTEDEQRANTRRYEATRQWQFGFGPAWSSKLNAPGPGTKWSLGYTWGLDPDFDLTLIYDWYSSRDDDDADFYTIGFGLDYFFSREKMSPFVGASIGYGSATAAQGCGTTFFCSSDDDASGWTIGASVGYKFFRTSSVNLGVIADYKYLFDKTTFGNPSTTAIRLVVYY